MVSRQPQSKPDKSFFSRPCLRANQWLGSMFACGFCPSFRGGSQGPISKAWNVESWPTVYVLDRLLNGPFPGLLRQFHRELGTFANLAGDGNPALMRFDHGLHQA